MTSAEALDYIRRAFPGLDIVIAPNDDVFVFYDPERRLPHDRRQPIVTLVHSDAYDTASNLARDGVYRLNIGVRPGTYRGLFGQPPSLPKDGGAVNTGHDFTAVDEILPHPVYAAMSWVCVLSPRDDTFRRIVEPLLSDAYQHAAERYSRHG